MPLLATVSTGSTATGKPGLRTSPGLCATAPAALFKDVANQLHESTPTKRKAV